MWPRRDEKTTPNNNRKKNHWYCLIDLRVEKTIYHLIIMKTNKRDLLFAGNNGSNYDI